MRKRPVKRDKRKKGQQVIFCRWPIIFWAWKRSRKHTEHIRSGLLDRAWL